MKFLLITIISLFIGYDGKAQNSEVLFRDSLDWTTVLAQAKQENKIIFLDFYTTWCGPCKAMDKEVYRNASVSDFVNTHFIAVKVQGDSSVDDSKSVKSSYAVAQRLLREFRITAYPTMLFLNPKIEIITKKVGYLNSNDFLTLCKETLTATTLYKDPYAPFESLAEQYSAGTKRFDSMMYMIKCATELGNYSLLKKLSTEYFTYLKGLPVDSLVNRDDILFISRHLKSKSPHFNLFYPDGSKVDTLLSNSKFSSNIVDSVIMQEIALPFLKKPLDVREFLVWNPKLIDRSEADWKKLYALIKIQYGRIYAKRNVLKAKVIWYNYHHNLPDAARSYFKKLRQYGVDSAFTWPGDPYGQLVEDTYTNGYAWEVFDHLKDRRLLKEAAKHMKAVIAYPPNLITGGLLDTYANLLYKLGKVSEAIEWQEKAVGAAIQFNYAPDLESISATLQKMKERKATWKEATSY